MLLLLIHNDQAQIRKWRKYSAARTDHDARLSIFDAFPLIHAFTERKRTMEYSDPVSIAFLKIASVCGVREISGTMTITPFPCADTSSIIRRNTCVFPLPVTPKRRETPP